MRIHRIVLRNYRGVGEVEIELPSEGVTIIEGENEAGKTSLSEAIDLLLTERDDASKRVVKAVKPVGRDVGAEVEIEMSTGPYRFRYRKRWHRQKETVLEMIEPHKSQLTGREAHDKVRAILDETLDGTLWEALRLRQGTQLEQAAFAGGSLGRALDLAAGGDAAGDREDDLWGRVTAERDRYWTATGHPKAERATSAGRVSDSTDRVAELRATLRGLEADADEVGRLVGEAGLLAGRQRDHDEVEAGLSTQLEAIGVHRNDVTRLAGLHMTAQAHRDRAFEVGRSRTDLVQRLADAAAAVGELELQVASALPARRQAEDHLRRAREEVDAGRARVREAETAQRRAATDRDYRRQQIELEQLSERHARVMDAARRRSEAELIADSSHVDDQLVERIEAAHVELARAEASAATGAVTVDTEALAAIDVQIDGRTVTLGVGERHPLVVAGSAEVVVPGAVKVVVTAGAEAQVLADRLSGARAAFESLCAEGQVAGVAEARQAVTARHEAERVVAEVATSIGQDLRDLAVEELALKVERLEARVAAYGSDRSAEPTLPPDLSSAQVLTSGCDETLQGRREELDRLEADLERVSGAAHELNLGSAGSKARLEQVGAAAAQEERALDAARRLLSDEDASRQLADAEVALLARAGELADAEARLAAEDPDSVEELLGNARDVKKRLADDLHQNEVRTRDLRTKLALRGEEGLAHKLDTALSELARLTAVHERTESRAAAARLLYEAFATRRAAAHHRYVAPFRERIEQLGRLVFGPTLEVELDDELRIARRTLDGVTLDFVDLSTGAKEQLGIISRLACASIVAADGGAPVIFDDALGWSDPRKLGRMGAVISVAGRSCQVIVLTCTPGRYAGVGSATVVQLAG